MAIAAWYCHEARAVFEIDGSHHQTDKRQCFRDWERDERLRVELGITTHRFTNSRVAEEGPFSVAIEIVDLVLEKLGRKRERGRKDLQNLWDRTLVEAFMMGYL